MFMVLSSWPAIVRLYLVHLTNVAQYQVAADLWTKLISLS